MDCSFLYKLIFFASFAIFTYSTYPSDEKPDLREIFSPDNLNAMLQSALDAIFTLTDDLDRLFGSISDVFEKLLPESKRPK